MIANALHLLGFGLCHQLPQRSFFGGGVQAPVCARDTGIYFGVLIGIGLVAALHPGERPREFPNRLGMVVAALFVGLMALDGITEYSGLRPTTNEIRLITGLMTGYAIAMIVTPMLNGEVWRRSGRLRVLAPSWRLGIFVATLPVSYVAIFYAGPMLGVIYPVLIGLAIIGALMAVNLVIVTFVPVFERRAEKWQDLLLPLAVSFALSIFEIAGAAAIKLLLLGLASRLA